MQALTAGQAEVEVVTDLVPRTLVLRFFLAPHHVGGIGVSLQLGRQLRTRERIQLFDTHEGDVVLATLCLVFEQVVIDLARAQHHALDLGRVGLGIRNQMLELALGQFFQARHCQLVAQQRLGRHHHQRLAGGHAHLAADHVEALRRRGRHAHQHVLQRAQLQEALKPCGAVLRALAFVAVRQEQRQARDPAPLGFASGDELVDHHLRAVGEVAELRFPDAQRIRSVVA